MENYTQRHKELDRLSDISLSSNQAIERDRRLETIRLSNIPGLKNTLQSLQSVYSEQAEDLAFNQAVEDIIRSDTPSVHAYADLLRKIINNILANSKHTKNSISNLGSCPGVFTEDSLTKIHNSVHQAATSHTTEDALITNLYKAASLVSNALLENKIKRDLRIYHIYPHSFKDTNGNGIGDLPGIIEELDYIKSLGVNTIWLSPIFLSPKHDMGYDIEDYYEIDPDYGNMQNFKQLIADAKRRGIAIMTDGVYNHTSYQHPWFVKAKTALQGQYKREYDSIIPTHPIKGATSAEQAKIKRTLNKIHIIEEPQYFIIQPGLDNGDLPPAKLPVHGPEHGPKKPEDETGWTRITGTKYWYFQTPHDYTEYYIFADSPKPNNWTTVLGKSGWSKLADTDYYYFHSFLPQQPDLNHNNPKVVSEIITILDFKRELGVIGERLDVFNTAFKNRNLESDPKVSCCEDTGRKIQGLAYLPHATTHINSRNHSSTAELITQPQRLMQTMQEMGMTWLAELLDETNADWSVYQKFIGPNKFPHAFNFPLMHAGATATAIQQALKATLQHFPHGGLCSVTGNHDELRLANRWKQRNWSSCLAAWLCCCISQSAATRPKILKLVPFLLALGLPGPVCIYQGDEFGQGGDNIPAAQCQDELKQQTLICGRTWTSACIPPYRDGARQPFAHSAGKNGGFSTATQTWLPVTTDYDQINAESQDNAPGSLLELYKAVMQLRKNNLAFGHEGSMQLLHQEHNIVSWIRQDENYAQFLVTLNFSSKSASYKPRDIDGAALSVECSKVLTSDDITPAANLCLQGGTSEITTIDKQHPYALPAYSAAVFKLTKLTTEPIPRSSSWCDIFCGGFTHNSAQENTGDEANDGSPLLSTHQQTQQSGCCIS